MTSEEKVKQLWPDATMDRVEVKWGVHNFRVTIKPGRYAYGRTKPQAWKAAWESITQDEELSKGEKGQ